MFSLPNKGSPLDIHDIKEGIITIGLLGMCLCVVYMCGVCIQV